MDRFILRYTGQGPKPAEDVERFGRMEDAKVIDDTSPRMVLVEADKDVLHMFLNEVPDWVMSPERTYSVPPSHPVIKKGKARRPPK